MNQEAIKLNPSSIMNVPLKSYADDFVFVVNGEEFKTSRLISDLLSPKICRMHSNDPTISSFVINTTNCGNFSHILDLLEFKEIKIQDNEFPFILEIIEILDNESIEYLMKDNLKEPTVDNVFSLIKQHEKFSKFYSKCLLTEINFVSMNFSELFDTKKEDLTQLDISTLEQIIGNEKLQLTDEDQLLRFINELYLRDSKYSILYDHVFFLNASSDAISEFVDVYDINDITNSTWKKISLRLKEEITTKDTQSNTNRYKNIRSKKESGIEFADSGQNKFDGIINYLKNKSNNKIENEIDFTSSSIFCNIKVNYPINVSLFNDEKNRFISNDEPNSWINLYFKNNQVIPTKYTIKTGNQNYMGSRHLKSWVLEGSTDNQNYEILDEENNCSYLNNSGAVYTFTIKNQTSKKYRSIRIKSTGIDWGNSNYLIIDSMEIFGKLI